MTQLGRKFDQEKPEMALLPPYAIEAVARVLTYGAKKYEKDNWKYVPDGEYRYRNAAFRHFNEVLKGNLTDPETGEHHLAHAICCMMFELDSYESGVPLKQALLPKPVQEFQPPTTVQLAGTAVPTPFYTASIK